MSIQAKRELDEIMSREFVAMIKVDARGNGTVVAYGHIRNLNTITDEAQFLNEMSEDGSMYYAMKQIY